MTADTDVFMARVWVPLAAFKQGDLPPVCAKTGRPAQRWLVVRATTLSSWAALPLLLLGIVPLLVALAVAPRVDGIVPLSVAADHRLRRAKIARWVLLALTGTLVVAWWLGLDLPDVQLVLAPLIMAVVLYGVEVAWSVGAQACGGRPPRQSRPSGAARSSGHGPRRPPGRCGGAGRG
jgi:hypothetical protein